jgi:hypothetical protein
MTTVWIVTQGEYSDYHIVGVFSTKEAAEALCARINAKEDYDKAQVEEYDVDNIAYGLKYIVRVTDTGEEIERYTVEGVNDTLLERADKAWKGGILGMSTRGYDAALKAARDGLAQLKAEGAGL